MCGYQELETNHPKKKFKSWTQNSSISEFSVSEHIVQIKQYRGRPHNQDNQNKRVRFAFFLSQRLRRASDMTSALLRKPFFDTGKNNITNVIAPKLFLDCLCLNG